MTENDFNTIKPVENLHNVAALTPAGQQQERKRRPQPPRPRRKPEAMPPVEATEQEASERGSEAHLLDYRA
jgi:hypothetical protein